LQVLGSQDRTWRTRTFASQVAGVQATGAQAAGSAAPAVNTENRIALNISRSS
jgi:hypothetical protein